MLRKEQRFKESNTNNKHLYVVYPDFKTKTVHAASIFSLHLYLELIKVHNKWISISTDCSSSHTENTNQSIGNLKL